MPTPPSQLPIELISKHSTQFLPPLTGPQPIFPYFATSFQVAQKLTMNPCTVYSQWYMCMPPTWPIYTILQLSPNDLIHAFSIAINEWEVWCNENAPKQLHAHLLLFQPRQVQSTTTATPTTPTVTHPPASSQRLEQGTEVPEINPHMLHHPHLYIMKLIWIWGYF